jgi:hypothetical protein
MEKFEKTVEMRINFIPHANAIKRGEFIFGNIADWRDF